MAVTVDECTTIASLLEVCAGGGGSGLSPGFGCLGRLDSNETRALAAESSLKIALRPSPAGFLNAIQEKKGGDIFARE